MGMRSTGVQIGVAFFGLDFRKEYEWNLSVLKV